MRTLGPVLCVVVLALTAGCGDEPARSVGQTAAGAGWTRLPDPPLAPRDQAVAVQVGGRMLVVGGARVLCPPLADCAFPDEPLLTDGALYDPATDGWTTVAEAPYGLRRDDGGTASIGESAFLLTGCRTGHPCGGPDRLLEYDATHDRWRDLGAAPWPDGYDRSAVATPEGLVVTASSRAALDAGTDAPRQAARLDLATLRWTRAPVRPPADAARCRWCPVGSTHASSHRSRAPSRAVQGGLRLRAVG